MDDMAGKTGPPESVAPWDTAADLYRAWLLSRATLEETPQPKTVEANSRKAQQLSDVLVDQADRTVKKATSLDGLRQGFWQESWVTDDATHPYIPRSIDRFLDDRLNEFANSGQGGLLAIVDPPKAERPEPFWRLSEALCRSGAWDCRV